MKAFVFGIALCFAINSCTETNSIPPSKEDISNEPVLVKPKRALLVRPLTFHKTIDMEEAQAKECAIRGIKHFEGFFSKSYVCKGGRNTVGYGFTGKFYSKTITRQKADYILENGVWDEYAAHVDKHVKVKLNAYQRAALIMFTYNTGEGNLKKLVNGPNRLNSGNYKGVPAAMALYTKAKGKSLKGLVRRRNWEGRLWNLN